MYNNEGVAYASAQQVNILANVGIAPQGLACFKLRDSCVTAKLCMESVYIDIKPKYSLCCAWVFYFYGGRQNGIYVFL